jgi:hypothetical protein
MYYAHQGQPIGAATEEMIEEDGVVIAWYGGTLTVHGRAVMSVVIDPLGLCVGEMR